MRSASQRTSAIALKYDELGIDIEKFTGEFIPIKATVKEDYSETKETIKDHFKGKEVVMEGVPVGVPVDNNQPDDLPF